MLQCYNRQGVIFMKKYIVIVLTTFILFSLCSCSIQRANDLKTAITKMPTTEDTSKQIIMQPAVQLPEDLHTEEAFIPQSHYPENEIIVCVYDVTSPKFGAVADGVTDDTNAINTALAQAAIDGGGCVYIPEGRYFINQTIYIPSSVSLCGDWINPEIENAGSKGTILIGGENIKNQDSFIQLRGESCGLMNVVVMYKQQASSAYPVAITQPTGNSATIQNVTIINVNDAISFGTQNASQLHTVKNVYISCLGIALFMDRIYDIGRLENIHVSPRYWQENIIYPVKDKQSIADTMFENATGFFLRRSDWEYTYNMFLEGLKNGIVVTKTEADMALTGSNAEFMNVYITDCDMALTIEYTNFIGLTFTNLQITTQNRDCTYAIMSGENFESSAQYIESSFTGNFSTLIKHSGQAFSMFTHCTFDAPEPMLNYSAGSASFRECTFKDKKIIGAYFDTLALSFLGCKFEISPEFNGADTLDKFIKDDTSLNLSYTSGKGHQYIKNMPLPYTKTLLSITSFGAVANDDEFDNTQAIQQTLNTCAAYGGGVVYIPQGQYTIKGHLTVPEGVLLSGGFMTSMHASNTVNASTLRVYTDQDNLEGQALITLNSHSGVKGFAIRYPDILSEDGTKLLHKYPYAIQSSGDGCYAIYITTPIAYNFIDFGTNPSPNHYVQYCSGCVVGTGVFAGNNNSNGWIENCHFNPHYSLSAREGIWDTIKFDVLSKNSDTFVFGYNESEHVLGNFVYGTRRGMYFISQNGKGTNGTFISHGSDYADRGISIDECGTIEIINAQIAAFGAGDYCTYFHFSKELTGNVYIFNPLTWLNSGPGIIMEGGNVLIQSFNYNNTQSEPVLCIEGSLCIEASCFDRYRYIFTSDPEMNDVYFIANNLTGYTGSKNPIKLFGLSNIKGHVMIRSNYQK